MGKLFRVTCAPNCHWHIAMIRPIGPSDIIVTQSLGPIVDKQMIRFYFWATLTDELIEEIGPLRIVTKEPWSPDIRTTWYFELEERVPRAPNKERKIASVVKFMQKRIACGQAMGVGLQIVRDAIDVGIKENNREFLSKLEASFTS